MSAAANDVHEQYRAEQKKRCGYCAGAGKAWSIERRQLERCPICLGTRRGTLRVWNESPIRRTKLVR